MLIAKSVMRAVYEYKTKLILLLVCQCKGPGEDDFEWLNWPVNVMRQLTVKEWLQIGNSSSSLCCAGSNSEHLVFE